MNGWDEFTIPREASGASSRAKPGDSLWNLQLVIHDPMAASDSHQKVGNLME